MKKENKTIMIFGAGINQLELIREAKEMKYTSVVIDPLESPPGKSEADYFYAVDGADYDTTREIALKHKIDGIVTGQMEKPLRLMARLADEFNFIFHPADVVERSIDKWLMKQTFIRLNVPCARAKHYHFTEDVNIENLRDFSFPLIIKPVDAFSSRGVYKVNNLDDVKSLINETRSFSTRGDIIIEEFLVGKEYSVESVTFKGKTSIIQITEKFITPFPNTVEIGHLQPAILSNDERKEIQKITQLAISAVGIDNSASHTEIMLTDEGPKVIEIGARLGGDFIASYLTKASTGVSMDRAAIQVALGIEPWLKQTKNEFSYIKYIELPVGKRVKEIFPIDNSLQIPGVVFINIFVKPGDIIQRIQHSGQRAGCIIIHDNSRDSIIKKMELIENHVKENIIKLDTI